MGRICLDINDIRKAGSIENAIIAYCENDKQLDAGKHTDCTYHAQQAMECGCIAYIDANDGRIIYAMAVNADTDPADICTDHAGEKFKLGEWSDKSVVELTVPTGEEVMENPDIAAKMATAVLDHRLHAAKSDVDGWRELVRQMTEVINAWATLTHG